MDEEDIEYDDYDERYEYGFGLDEYDANGNLIEDDEEEEPIAKGRPKKYYSKPKVVQIKCTSYEHQLLKELSELSGKSMTKIIKECAFNKLNELKMSK